MMSEPVFELAFSTPAGKTMVSGDRDNIQRLIAHISDPGKVFGITARPQQAVNVILPVAVIDAAQEQLLALITAGGDDIAECLTQEQPLAQLLDVLLPHWRPMMLSLLDQL